MKREEMIEAMARAIDPDKFEFWKSSYDYKIDSGASADDALQFANWCHKLEPIRQQAEAALSAIEPTIEQAFKDGLAYGTNVADADPDMAWQQSRIRAELESGRLK